MCTTERESGAGGRDKTRESPCFSLVSQTPWLVTEAAGESAGPPALQGPPASPGSCIRAAGPSSHASPRHHPGPSPGPGPQTDGRPALPLSVLLAAARQSPTLRSCLSYLVVWEFFFL